MRMKSQSQIAKEYLDQQNAQYQQQAQQYQQPPPPRQYPAWARPQPPPQYQQPQQPPPQYQQPQQPPPPPPPPHQPTYPAGTVLVPMKVAAQESYNWLKKVKYLSTASIAGYFIVLLVFKFNEFAGAGAAVLGVSAAAYYLASTQKEMKRLEGKYGVR